MAGSAVDFLLEYLNQLISCKDIYNQFSDVEKLQIKSVYKDLSSLRTFLMASEMSWYKHEEFKDLVIRITNMANKAEDIIDLSIVSDIFGKKVRVGGTFYHVYQSGMLINVLNEIKSLKKEVSDCENKVQELVRNQLRIRVALDVQKAALAFIDARSDLPIVEEEETVVGFDNDVKAIRERLVGGSKKLDVISIVGMPGLGPTEGTERRRQED